MLILIYPDILIIVGALSMSLVFYDEQVVHSKKANSFLYCIVKIVNSKIFIVSATMIDQFSWRLRHTLEEHLFHFDAECFK